jgi:hypothetical protein
MRKSLPVMSLPSGLSGAPQRFRPRPECLRARPGKARSCAGSPPHRPRSVRPLAIGVTMMPGLIELTRAPRLPHRTASAITRSATRGVAASSTRSFGWRSSGRPWRLILELPLRRRRSLPYGRSRRKPSPRRLVPAWCFGFVQSATMRTSLVVRHISHYNNYISQDCRHMGTSVAPRATARQLKGDGNAADGDQSVAVVATGRRV